MTGEVTMKIRFLSATGLLAASAFLLSCALPIPAQETPSGSVPVFRAPESDSAQTGPREFPQGMLFPYSLLDRAFTGNVDLKGNVDYLKLKDNADLKLFLEATRTADLSKFPTFNVYEEDPKTGRKTEVRKVRSPELVFWINAYTAHRLAAIAEAYPIRSINEIKDFDTAKTHEIAGEKYSFKELRAKIASFGDPRALFALPTGTAGGFLPSPKAVRWSEFDARMNAAVEVFVNDPRNVSLNRIQNTVTLNPEFREIDEFMQPSGKYRKGEGIRAALAGYTKQRANRSFFTTNDFRINYGAGNHAINDMDNDPSMEQPVVNK